MKLNLTLVAAALVYALPGLALTFAPAESLAALGTAASPLLGWLAQLLGAALLGLALLNGLLRYSVVGGLFGRPLLAANLLFLSAAFFPSLRLLRSEGGPLYLTATLLLGLLLLAFGYRLWFGSPRAVAGSNDV